LLPFLKNKKYKNHDINSDKRYELENELGDRIQVQAHDQIPFLEPGSLPRDPDPFEHISHRAGFNNAA